MIRARLSRDFRVKSIAYLSTSSAIVSTHTQSRRRLGSDIMLLLIVVHSWDLTVTVSSSPAGNELTSGPARTHLVSTYKLKSRSSPSSRRCCVDGMTIIVAGTYLRYLYSMYSLEVCIEVWVELSEINMF